MAWPSLFHDGDLFSSRQAGNDPHPGDRNAEMSGKRNFDGTICSAVPRRFFDRNGQARIETENEILKLRAGRPLGAGFCKNKNLHFFRNKRAEFMSGKKSVTKL